jgi:hypothetical protein
VQSNAALQACLNQTDNPQLAEALLPYAKVTASAATDGGPANVTATTRHKSHRRHVRPHAATTCRTDTDQHTIGIAGINVGWQKFYVNYWADPGVRITSTNTSAVRWSAFLYCWTNTNDWWVWHHYPTWQDAYASGALGGNTGFGCISLQSDKPWIEYNSVGQAWFH